MQQESKVIKSADPMWQETFRFYPSTKHQSIDFTVLDYDGPAAFSEVIGTCSLNLEDVPEVGISTPSRWVLTLTLTLTLIGGGHIDTISLG